VGGELKKKTYVNCLNLISISMLTVQYVLLLLQMISLNGTLVQIICHPVAKHFQLMWIQCTGIDVNPLGFVPDLSMRGVE
jgi:hypothetical protein